jgi:uncharacterized protein (DUF952 family)
MTNECAAMLIYKIMPRAEWEKIANAYDGSADDKRDGFIHFSTQSQLAGTLAKHYAGQTDLVLLAIEADSLGDALKWELAPKRGEEFPHLYAPLPKAKVLWARAISGNNLPI